MNKEEILIEIESLSEACYQLCKGDGYMCTKTAAIVDMMRDRIKNLSDELIKLE
ncbi:hypothetical protein UFOVP1290_350 [uncultured Caudovirales phage]|uniref:Uncharacterized protein n=1 Tax=uncultured Caudovirales phage TaxID=2100421 RepID=A0A6J5RH55_9CAUD|nr:hypothetical protein UFOVP1290_350 [uncultured Caudovirales phage]